MYYLQTWLPNAVTANVACAPCDVDWDSVRAAVVAGANAAVGRATMATTCRVSCAATAVVAAAAG